MNNSIIDKMVEVQALDDSSFRRVVETLTRMGVESKREKNVLSQTAHILHKKGKYYIAHFKEMMALDGKEVDLTEGDFARRNLIASMLSDWGMIKIVDRNSINPVGMPNTVKILKHSEKEQWRLVPKYTMGKTK